jgi:hypothetical protein
VGLGRTDHDLPWRPKVTEQTGEAGASLRAGQSGRATRQSSQSREFSQLSAVLRPASGDLQTRLIFYEPIFSRHHRIETSQNPPMHVPAFSQQSALVVHFSSSLEQP